MLQIHKQQLNNLSQEDGDLDWHVIYTYPKYEAKVLQEFVNFHIEAFLPVQKELRFWSDRKKIIYTPMFLRYLFVRVEQANIWKPLMIKGVQQYVKFGDQLAKVKNEVINNLKIISGRQQVIVGNSTYSGIGEEMEIKNGIFAGLKGNVVSVNGKKKLSINIQELGSSCLIDID